MFTSPSSSVLIFALVVRLKTVTTVYLVYIEKKSDHDDDNDNNKRGFTIFSMLIQADNIKNRQYHRRMFVHPSIHPSSRAKRRKMQNHHRGIDLSSSSSDAAADDDGNWSSERDCMREFFNYVWLFRDQTVIKTQLYIVWQGKKLACYYILIIRLVGSFFSATSECEME